MRRELPRPHQGQQPLVLSAGFPDEDDDVPSGRLLDIEEALLSLARASFAQGRRLILPADPIVAALVGRIAAEYGEDLRTESTTEREALVCVLFTEAWDDDLAGALSALGHVRVVGPAEPGPKPSGRQRLTVQALKELDPSLVPSDGVVFGGAPESLEDVAVLRELGLPIHVIASATTRSLLDRGELRQHDILGRRESLLRWEPKAGDGAELAVPYPYLMQQLIEELGPNNLAV